MKIEYEVIQVGEEDDYSFMFSFNFSTDDFSTTVVIEEPYLVSRNRWVEFIKTIRDRGNMTLHFYQGNGYGILSTSNGKIKFGAMPSEAGGDLSINFELVLKHTDLMADYLNEMIDHPITKCMEWRGLNNN